MPKKNTIYPEDGFQHQAFKKNKIYPENAMEKKEQNEVTDNSTLQGETEIAAPPVTKKVSQAIIRSVPSNSQLNHGQDSEYSIDTITQKEQLHRAESNLAEKNYLYAVKFGTTHSKSAKLASKVTGTTKDAVDDVSMEAAVHSATALGDDKMMGLSMEEPVANRQVLTAPVSTPDHQRKSFQQERAAVELSVIQENRDADGMLIAKDLIDSMQVSIANAREFQSGAENPSVLFGTDSTGVKSYPLSLDLRQSTASRIQSEQKTSESSVSNQVDSRSMISQEYREELQYMIEDCALDQSKMNWERYRELRALVSDVQAVSKHESKRAADCYSRVMYKNKEYALSLTMRGESANELVEAINLVPGLRTEIIAKIVAESRPNASLISRLLTRIVPRAYPNSTLVPYFIGPNDQQYLAAVFQYIQDDLGATNIEGDKRFHMFCSILCVYLRNSIEVKRQILQIIQDPELIIEMEDSIASMGKDLDQRIQQFIPKLKSRIQLEKDIDVLAKKIQSQTEQLIQGRELDGEAKGKITFVAKEVEQQMQRIMQGQESNDVIKEKIIHAADEIDCQLQQIIQDEKLNDETEEQITLIADEVHCQMEQLIQDLKLNDEINTDVTPVTEEIDGQIQWMTAKINSLPTINSLRRILLNSSGNSKRVRIATQNIDELLSLCDQQETVVLNDDSDIMFCFDRFPNKKTIQVCPQAADYKYFNQLSALLSSNRDIKSVTFDLYQQQKRFLDKYRTSFIDDLVETQYFFPEHIKTLEFRNIISGSRNERSLYDKLLAKKKMHHIQKLTIGGILEDDNSMKDYTLGNPDLTDRIIELLTADDSLMPKLATVDLRTANLNVLDVDKITRALCLRNKILQVELLFNPSVDRSYVRAVSEEQKKAEAKQRTEAAAAAEKIAKENAESEKKMLDEKLKWAELHRRELEAKWNQLVASDKSMINVPDSNAVATAKIANLDGVSKMETDLQNSGLTTPESQQPLSVSIANEQVAMDDLEYSATVDNIIDSVTERIQAVTTDLHDERQSMANQSGIHTTAVQINNLGLDNNEGHSRNSTPR